VSTRDELQHKLLTRDDMIKTLRGQLAVAERERDEARAKFSEYEANLVDRFGLDFQTFDQFYRRLCEFKVRAEKAERVCAVVGQMPTGEGPRELTEAWQEWRGVAGGDGG